MMGINSSLSSQFFLPVVKAFMDDLFLMFSPSFNFIKIGWADFLLIEYEGLAKMKNLVFLGIYSFGNKFQETVKLFFEY